MGPYPASTVTEAFIQPAIDGEVVVSVSASTWMAEGQTIYIETGGYYAVSGIPDETSVSIVNTGAVGNAPPGFEIDQGARVVVAGSPPSSGLPVPWDLTPSAAEIYPVLTYGIPGESLPNSGIIDGDELVLPFSDETGIKAAVAYYAAVLRTSEPLQAAVWRPKPDTYSVAPGLLINNVSIVDRETGSAVVSVSYYKGAGLDGYQGAGLVVTEGNIGVYADAGFDPAAGNIVVFYFSENSPSTITISTSSGGITDQPIWSGSSLSEVSLVSVIQASASSPTNGECRAVIDTNFSSLDGLTLWPDAVALEQMVTSLPEDAKNGDVLVVEVPGEYGGEQYGINNAGMPDGAVVIDKAAGIVLPLRNSRYYGPDNPPPRRSLNLAAFDGVGSNAQLLIQPSTDGWYIQGSVNYPLENINFTVSGVSSGDSFQIATAVPLLNCQVGTGGQGFSMAAGEIKTATYIDGQWFVSAPVAPLEATYADLKLLPPEPYAGQQVWCTDYDVFVRSMGTYWLATSPIQLINDTDTLTGTTDETIMRAYLIPRAILREKHSVRFTVRAANTANNSSVRVRLNTINGLLGASGSHYAVTSTSALSVDKTLLCVNNSTQGTGGGSSGSANSGNSSMGVTTSIDTSDDYYVLITGQLTNSDNTLNLIGSSVIIQPCGGRAHS